MITLIILGVAHFCFGMGLSCGMYSGNDELNKKSTFFDMIATGCLLGLGWSIIIIFLSIIAIKGYFANRKKQKTQIKKPVSNSVLDKPQDYNLN